MEVARRASASANGKRLFVSGVANGVMKPLEPKKAK